MEDGPLLIPSGMAVMVVKTVRFDIVVVVVVVVCR
jgi:hypothetical protein